MPWGEAGACGRGDEENDEKGSARPEGSRVIGVLKSFNRRKDGSERIVPERETARRVRRVSTRLLSSLLPVIFALSLVSMLPVVCEDELYQKKPATTKTTVSRITLCLEIKSIIMVVANMS